MLGTSARLLRLLTLLQSRRAWTGPNLAERLEVTDRTLRRDIDRLRSLGYPVHATSGVAGGYRLAPGTTLPPLLLADDEALAVSLALGTTASSPVAGIDEAALRALVKLEQVLPKHLQRRAKALRASIVQLDRLGPIVDASMIATLAGACRDNERLSFHYEASDSKKTERLVEPAGLVHAGSRWYLVAWDTQRDAWRTFRVDRIAGKVVIGTGFSPRPAPEGDLKAYVAHTIASGAYTHKAEVILLAPLETVSKRVRPLSVTLERLDEERCMLKTGAQSLDHLSYFILHLGVDFEIVKPPELQDHFRELRQRLSRSVARGVAGVDTRAKPG